MRFPFQATIFTLTFVFNISSYPYAAELNMRPIEDIHTELLNKFTPIDQPHNDRAINHSGDVPFTGDCDDSYAAAFNQLYVYGYSPYAQIWRVKATGQRHIVACVEVGATTQCLDHNRKRVSRVRDMRQFYSFVESRKVVDFVSSE